ncbi:hypothetical protein BDW02DRAFT_650639 [Decorospora gaudefroyi]|uniref:Zinc finger PHD-type domain-containing protein n=1 Tax=Decorospora gaudefroyi TaxID=184978 RepID=A0A6A5JZ60_9PLEO|nr:hypothetical protein BDW02DRAFT_650639 [Decorospora gaudefroyi]
MVSQVELVANDAECQQVEQALNADGLYKCSPNFWVYSFKFPMPGKESSDALRKYLQKWTPVASSIPYDHLLALQGIFWREISSLYAADLNAPTSRATSYWRDVQDVAENVKHITNLLKDEHIFVLHAGPSKTCNNTACPKEDKVTKQPGRPQTITVEPLLHWGTVTPASELRIAEGKIFPFRRNGIKMEDGLWTQQVKKLVPNHPPTYCVKCLEELMTRRVEAWAIIDHPSQTGHGYGRFGPIQRPQSKSDLYDRREGSERSNVAPTARYEPAGTPQLDGAHNEVEAELQQPAYHLFEANEGIHAGACRDGVKVTEAVTSRLPPPSFTALSEPIPVMENATPRSGTFNSPYPPLRHRFSTPSTDRTLVNRDPQPNQTDKSYEKLGSKALLEGSIPEFESQRREFGRPIDTNVVCQFFHQHRARRSRLMATDKSEGHEPFLPTNPPTGSKQAANRAVKAFLPVYKDENESENENTNLSPTVADLSANEAVKPPAKAHKGKGKAPPASPKQTATNTLSFPPPYLPILRKQKQNPEPQPPYLPVFRKQPKTPEPPPPDVTPQAWHAHQTHIPDKTALICICHQPARTYDVPLTQCVNAACPIVWYHKHCLDKRGKIQARFGTHLCDICSTARFFRQRERDMGFTMEDAVRDEIGLPFSDREILDALPKLGGFEAVRWPYGLGLGLGSGVGEAGEGSGGGGGDGERDGDGERR